MAWGESTKGNPSPYYIFSLITAIFVGISLLFLIDAIFDSSILLIKNPDFLDAAVAMGTIGMAFFVGIQSYFIRKSTEQQEMAIRFPLMVEHTQKLQTEVINPLTSIFKRIFVDTTKKHVTLTVGVGTSYVLNGTENLEDLCKIAGVDINTHLLDDLLDNHAPDLKQAFTEFMSAVFSLTNGYRVNESAKVAKQLLDEIRLILLDLSSYEVFLDECSYVRGSTKERRKRKRNSF